MRRAYSVPPSLFCTLLCSCRPTKPASLPAYLPFCKPLGALYIHKRNPFEHFAESANTGYFGFEGAKTDTPRLFLTMTLSVFALSLAMGVVEGSPFRFIEGSAPPARCGLRRRNHRRHRGIIIGAAWRPLHHNDYRHLDSHAGAWHYRTFYSTWHFPNGSP